AVDPDQVVSWARWTPPPGPPRRLATCAPPARAHPAPDGPARAAAPRARPAPPAGTSHPRAAHRPPPALRPRPPPAVRDGPAVGPDLRGVADEDDRRGGDRLGDRLVAHRGAGIVQGPWQTSTRRPSWSQAATWSAAGPYARGAPCGSRPACWGRLALGGVCSP